jgi:hypothetical protein
MARFVLGKDRPCPPFRKFEPRTHPTPQKQNKNEGWYKLYGLRSRGSDRS